jgi:hypothetical protein
VKILILYLIYRSFWTFLPRDLTGKSAEKVNFFAMCNKRVV